MRFVFVSVKCFHALSSLSTLAKSQTWLALGDRRNFDGDDDSTGRLTARRVEQTFSGFFHFASQMRMSFRQLGRCSSPQRSVAHSPRKSSAAVLLWSTSLRYRRRYSARKVCPKFSSPKFSVVSRLFSTHLYTATPQNLSTRHKLISLAILHRSCSLLKRAHPLHPRPQQS